ncbi:unnamed protein product [Prorocentrum cordatum]|uniref:CUB domain-containing protein n=1 Tax=Prorocentrum cordatum TaxID=2364126 RepID=A0ABN9UZ37_9DINO|nr:unnamed protein product [Polarella glacialis]
MTWALAPNGSCEEQCRNGGACSGGVCQCVDGWAGADCSHSSCMGTSRLSALETEQTIVHGAAGYQTGHNANCTWIITADSGKVVFFEFVKLDLDWLFDPLEFYDGDTRTGTKIGSFSGYAPSKLNASVGERCPGAMCPLALHSSSSTAAVRWTSDAMQSGEGFELKYRAVALTEALCGTGPTADCTGRGTCGINGCQCNEGWFGQFCQVQQCVGPATDLTAATGMIINMAATELTYAPARSCSWLVTPPASYANETVGAVAFRIKRFDMEAAESSGDSLTFGEGNGSFTLSGMNPPCSEDISGCESDADCRGGICDSSGTCTCSHILIAGAEVLVQFMTDSSDYPPGSLHAGFEVEFAAVYQCTRGASGACLTPAPCTPGSVPKTVGGVEMCDPCPAGQYQMFDMATELPKCSYCPLGKYTDKQMQTECMLCDPGNYCPFAAHEMLPCPAGTYAGVAGTAACEPCPVGTYTNTTGSTSCTSCSTGKANPDLYATQSQVLVSGTSEWVPTTGAESAAACGCKVGAYEKDGECELCGEGMECPGMGEVIIAPGYFASADRPGFVWRCYGTDHRRCPGGPPGTCAPSRLTSSVACTTCEDGMVASDEGDCKDCSPVHVLPILMILTVAGAAMLLLYRILGSSDPASRSRSVLLVATVAGQLFTFVQQLGIMGTISLEWESPFAEFLVTISLFNFNLDYLFLECATALEPVSKFTGRVFLVIAFVLSMIVIHSIAVVVHHAGAFRERNPALICSVGTVFSTFFMSIMASMLAPFQCAAHPNGLQTVRDYPSVVCYESMETRLAAGDERFLRSFLFLFFRFRPGAHTYIAVFLFRNLFISVVPALGNTMFQIITMQAILIPLLVVTVYFMPWSAFLANLIDGSSTMLLCLIVTLFAFYCEDADAEVVAQLCTAICIIAFLTIFCAIAWGMLTRVLRIESPMQFFLCHHLAGAGNFTRLLKMSLDKKSKKEIGVDSDYTDPSALFATVASDVDMLVVVCSKQIAFKIFCVGEMSTATLNKVPVCNVLLPDFAYPSEDFVTKYEIEMPHITHLARYGLNLETVKASLPNSGQESVRIPSLISSSTMQSLVGVLMREQGAVPLPDDTGTIDPLGSSSLFIVADMGALECTCAALVLQLLLARSVQGRRRCPSCCRWGRTCPCPRRRCASCSATAPSPPRTWPPP